MADLTDQAQDLDALRLAEALQLHQQRAAASSRPQALGHCLNPACEEPFGADAVRLFCGPACNAEYHRRGGK